MWLMHLKVAYDAKLAPDQPCWPAHSIATNLHMLVMNLWHDELIQMVLLKVS